ncbi:hypothetical protein EMIHUDRAFT_450538 [Emiliania huxleyi CCMP1516]|uniref:PAS domain-containing protein n=2 Tax=Emiliania huxleyi TaxID=2903 RepID=A0A0D3JM69_EMIH1|nr:hypothetical protein EMIHUDRAFT_450538 [Emiliania huxleyi CCMP1516]EOD24604.1 hypothetical protein EMIHUDRAFT_450538 [Emiliania huxleyi CCMP1516]|eukprot:XP_005777033.1 hypothetical protein EMIHUDRAFT_450538 [Emiliania huxleyi CCMP1516]
MVSDRRSLTLAESLSLTDEARIVCESAPPYRIIHTNVAWKEACGFSFIEGEETQRAALETLSLALQQKRPVNVKLINYRKDGTPFLNSLHVAPVKGGSHFYGRFVTAQPITDGSVAPREETPELNPVPEAPVSYVGKGGGRCQRRVSQAQLADMLESEDPYVLCSSEWPHVITHASPAWCEMCGYMAEEVEGLTNKILTGPDTDSEALASLLAHVRAEEPTVQTVWNYKKGGERFLNQAAVTVLPLYDESHELAAFASILKEVDSEDLAIDADAWRRLSAEFADRALAELVRRLLGERPAAPGSEEEGAVWQRVAQILPARIATEVIDGRPPDMSPAAARAIIEETRRNA